MKVKSGDVLEFVAISWNDGWDFDYPTVILNPIITHFECGKDCESAIEDVAIDLTFKDIINEPFKELCEWRGWKLSILKRVIRDRENGKKTWKTKLREILKQKIKFFTDDYDGGLNFEIIETNKIY